MEGGAYGAFSYPRNMDGLFLLGSYRDPNIASTLRAFGEGLRLMESGPLDAGEVDKAVIGTIGREDRPDRPGEKGFVSLQRTLHGITDEARQARRDVPPGRGEEPDRRGGKGADPALGTRLHGGHRQPADRCRKRRRRSPSSRAESPIFRNRDGSST